MTADKELAELERLYPYVREYQALAQRHGIRDIFQDNGGKLLQLALITKLKLLTDREGNDAKDENGKEYELKTANIDLVVSFSTHHHLNPTILKKYRTVEGWVFAMYQGIELIEIYKMPPSTLEPIFSKWEKKWHDEGGKDINNPKIPVNFVRQNGAVLYKAPIVAAPTEKTASAGGQILDPSTKG